MPDSSRPGELGEGVITGGGWTLPGNIPKCFSWSINRMREAYRAARARRLRSAKRWFTAARRAGVGEKEIA